MKKIMLLGGSAQQVVAIEKAKELGYKTILCDYLPDNPGQFVADVFYQVSTTDKLAVLDVARKENIDGILAYASDPAAPTAAFVAEKMGLPGNPYESVEILCNKDKFRDFLKKNNFCTPKAKGYDCVDDCFKDIKNGIFKLPVIVKPVDSSGSKGVSRIDDEHNIRPKLENAMSFSKNGKIIIEEFVEKKHRYLIGGDIFVINGEIVLWGLLNCHRDETVNSLVPVGKSYPLMLGTDEVECVKEFLQNLVDKLNIKNGAMNVEIIIDKENRVYPIDIGPRSGGNMIPDLLGYIFNVDIIEMIIKCSVGEEVELKSSINDAFYATHNLHSDKNGILSEIKFSENIERFIFDKKIYKKRGDEIRFFDNASKAIGILFMKFDSMNQMLDMMDNSEKWIEVVLKDA